jgi:hypothetical protein
MHGSRAARSPYRAMIKAAGVHYRPLGFDALEITYPKCDED